MTRKDYELIAAAINGVRTSVLRHPQDTETRKAIRGAKLDAIDGIAYRLAGDLARTNPRFDVDRFVAACIEE